MPPVHNHFAHPDAAARYERGRKYFHPAAVARLAELTGRTRFPRALDLCCGTGLSTRALLAVADEVVGVDASAAMLAHAPRMERIRYVQSPAETLPFADGSFDLATVASGFHWLERERFLPEAARVLGPGGWLALYWPGRPQDWPAYRQWYDSSFRARYPETDRHAEPLTAASAAAYGFETADDREEPFVYEETFTPESLADYLCSQSQLNAAIEGGRESAVSAHAWLVAELAPLFAGRSGRFTLTGRLRRLRVFERARPGGATAVRQTL